MKAQEIVPLLLDACPSAVQLWDEHVQWWGDCERGYYNDVAVFAHYVVDSHTQGKTHELPGFFAALETMLTEGDQQVQELATIGLIEDIQNIASHQPGQWHVFEPWLKPRSQEAWRQVEQMWEGVPNLMEMLRRESGPDSEGA